MNNKSHCTGESLCKFYSCNTRGYCLLKKYVFDIKKITINKTSNKRNERLFWESIHPKKVVSLIMNGHDASCVCCKSLNNLTFDHIIPLSKGGMNNLENGQILCLECNHHKSNKIISIKHLRKQITKI